MIHPFSWPRPKDRQEPSDFDPNPNLASLALGSVRIYKWQDPHGREARRASEPSWL
jgi:hypothetical protein